ncbi:hypothetical protein [Geomonas anaerohicana]|uniref:Uncharacterized protein n=1 Tax=Geomonas anaerohicana TaxID=2798583 RepID=A0ABS0YC35_9BACT|nr:hypothetical protein [Geomonas anaerohicana]MBJ6749862.1 hypothetical protein [Geomonas anaerohicana]
MSISINQSNAPHVAKKMEVLMTAASVNVSVYSEYGGLLTSISPIGQKGYGAITPSRLCVQPETLIHTVSRAGIDIFFYFTKPSL